MSASKLATDMIEVMMRTLEAIGVEVLVGADVAVWRRKEMGGNWGSSVTLLYCTVCRIMFNV